MFSNIYRRTGYSIDWCRWLVQSRSSKPSKRCAGTYSLEIMAIDTRQHNSVRWRGSRQLPWHAKAWACHQGDNATWAGNTRAVMDVEWWFARFSINHITPNANTMRFNRLAMLINAFYCCCSIESVHTDRLKVHTSPTVRYRSFMEFTNTATEAIARGGAMGSRGDILLCGKIIIPNTAASRYISGIASAIVDTVWVYVALHGFIKHDESVSCILSV